MIDVFDFTLTPQHEGLLRQLVGSRVRQVVWDVNALYVVQDKRAVVVEVFGDTPGTSVATDKYDEVVFVRPWSIAPAPMFQAQGEEGYWYKVVAEDIEITGVEVARTAVVFPDGRIVPPSDDPKLVVADVGVILSLREGVVPAVLLENSFGFAIWPEIRIFERSEAMRVVGNAYELRSLTAA